LSAGRSSSISTIWVNANSRWSRWNSTLQNSRFSTEQYTAYLGQVLCQPQRFFGRHLADHITAAGLRHPHYHPAAVIIQLKLDITSGCVHIILHLRHRRQYLFAIRFGHAGHVGHAVILAHLERINGPGRFSCFTRSGSRCRGSYSSPAIEHPHIHGFSSTQDKAGEESPLPPPVMPLTYP